MLAKALQQTGGLIAECYAAYWGTGKDVGSCRARHEPAHAEFPIMPSKQGERQWDGALMHFYSA
jgi:hypothetical protein